MTSFNWKQQFRVRGILTCKHIVIYIFKRNQMSLLLDIGLFQTVIESKTLEGKRSNQVGWS